MATLCDRLRGRLHCWAVWVLVARVRSACNVGCRYPRYMGHRLTPQ